MKTKDLEKEGITESILKSVNINKLGNPVQLQPNDNPVNLIRCSKGFWVSVDCEIVKDKNDEFIVITDKEAKIARARYLVNFVSEVENDNQEAIQRKLKLKIDTEVERLKALVDEAVPKYLSEIKFILQLAGLIDGDMGFTIRKHLLQETDKLEESVSKAKDICSQDDYLYSYEVIKKWYDEDNYDDLYSYFFQKGTYQIAQFNLPNLFNSTDIEVLQKFFSRDAIFDTIDEIKSKSHLENVAKFNVEKRQVQLKN